MKRSARISYDVNLKDVKRNAFWNGFFDGISAPSFLVQYPQVFHVRETSVVDAWKQVGDAMSLVISSEIVREEAKEASSGKQRLRA